jgi:hypothetical protein
MSSYYNLIENLKPIDKEIISLRILSDFTFDKIAQMLNMPIGTVEWRYYKSLHYIKLSISNLAAFIIVFTVWKSVHTSKEELPQSDTVPQESQHSSSGKSDSFSLSDMSTSQFLSSETVGTIESASTIFKIDFSFILSIVCIIFIFLTIFFVFKKKLKKK